MTVRITHTNQGTYDENHFAVKKWSFYALGLVEEAGVDMDALDVPRFWYRGEAVPPPRHERDYRAGAGAGEAAPDPRLRLVARDEVVPLARPQPQHTPEHIALQLDMLRRGFFILEIDSVGIRFTMDHMAGVGLSYGDKEEMRAITQQRSWTQQDMLRLCHLGDISPHILIGCLGYHDPGAGRRGRNQHLGLSTRIQKDMVSQHGALFRTHMTTVVDEILNIAEHTLFRDTYPTRADPRKIDIMCWRPMVWG